MSQQQVVIEQVSPQESKVLVEAVTFGWLDEHGVWSTQLDISIGIESDVADQIGPNVTMRASIVGYDVTIVQPVADDPTKSNIFVTHYGPEEVAGVVAQLLGRGISRRQIQAAFATGVDVAP